MNRRRFFSFLAVAPFAVPAAITTWGASIPAILSTWDAISPLKPGDVSRFFSVRPEDYQLISRRTFRPDELCNFSIAYRAPQ